MVTGISMTGMASGMDTDEIVNELMQLERVPIQRMEFEKEEISTIQEQWQTVNQQLQGLKGSFDDLASRSIYNDMSASSTNEDAVSVSADSSADAGNYAINVEQLAQAHSVYGVKFESGSEPINSEENQETGVTISGDETFTIGFDGHDAEDHIEIDLSDIDKAADEITLRDIRSLINQQPDLEATATLVDNRLVINSDNTGEEFEMVFQDTEGSLLQDIGIIGDDNTMQAAQDAIFSINGLEGITSSTNQGISDVIDGVTIDLHSATESPANVSVGQDTEAIGERVQQFVEQYNEAQTFMHELGKEDGLLQGDGTLRRLQSSLRRNITNDVGLADNEFNNIQSLGIEIDDEGNMEFNPGDLETALREDPEAVENFFRARESDHGADGLARRMSSFVEEYVRFGGGRTGGILNRQDQNFDSQMDRIDRRIEQRMERMERREQTMQRQFARMETALNEIQAQGGWLQGQLQNLGLQQG
ncbi:flagellar filament capping protein FliD [Halanaerobiaceae bacterium Z-7014]|uniref:Flagellar hook-associated protein 2 n=1 Tax=Halonatronomonas betaini TaxID=2778430 RepID=A0A931F7E6_9FIRM|nr:flagellar filament capping protein FliD [Halonatronomonas betaini]MBF8437860.1 flagellar filament capping protein FliD [Halonatronomonas betaini]